MQHCDRTGFHSTGTLGLSKSRMWLERRHGVRRSPSSRFRRKLN
ncbi:hypothetical protein [Chroococcidiopsis sp. SAG 2025]|nr:hypothetical protein [Chroococcidiopsis sp. SAG 2025]